MSPVTRSPIGSDRFNRQGIDGLIERPRTGRPAKITAEHDARYKELIDHPEQVGVTHWTGRKFHGYLRRELSHEVDYSTVLNWLHDQSYRLKVPQPWPDRQDGELRLAFCQCVRQWLKDQDVELWYYGRDGRGRRSAATTALGDEGGQSVQVTHNGDHVRMNVSGLICPRTGQCYALEFSHSDGEVFQCFLDHANADLKLERVRNLLILDNAGWHKGARLKWGRFEPVYLPPYSPALNPIERLWLVLKAEWFTDFVAENRQALMERLDKALV